MVINGKKLTVKYFLNKDVKGKRAEFMGTAKFPVYARVTYNRKTTKFPLGNFWFTSEFEEDLEKIPELKEAKKAIGKIVEHEINNTTGIYNILGLGDRIKTYISNLSKAINTSLNSILSKELGAVMSYNNFVEWKKMPFAERVEKGLMLLGQSMSENLYFHVILSALMNKFGVNYSVHEWIMTNARKEFLDNLKSIGKSNNLNLAFNFVPIIGLEKEENRKQIVKLIDSICNQLLKLKYTSFVEIKSIEYDALKGIIKVKTK